MEFIRGMRDQLEKYFNISSEIEIEICIRGGSVYDFTCLGLDAQNKLSDERYMIFNNQTHSPENEIVFIPGNDTAVFQLQLSKIPQQIRRLVFAVGIDGNGTMGEIISHRVSIKQKDAEEITMDFKGSDFHNEKAIISFEIYRKDVFRIASVANGFDGGISELLKHYGGIHMTKEQSISELQIQMSNAVVETEETKELSFDLRSITQQEMKEKISLKKGEKVSFIKKKERPIMIENGWTAKGKDYDLKALVRYRDGKLIYIGAANKDEELRTPDGAVIHGGDIKNSGELEHIEISWHPDIASVAVSSYSALENGTGSFHQYGVFVRIKNGSQIIEIPAANTSANDRSYTLCFGEIIFGDTPDSFEVSALEMYSKPNSERRIGYENGEVVMDIGPRGQKK